MIDTAIGLEALNRRCEGTMMAHLGIEFTDIGPEHLTARMPVDRRTVQPYGLLHGGASVALAESLGSAATACCIDTDRHVGVGVAINANHIRPVRSGYVYGTARPVHLGSRTHVWEIRIVDEQERLVCVSRLTMLIVERSTEP